MARSIRITDVSAPLGTVGNQVGLPSAWDNRRGTRSGRRAPTSSASRRWTCPDCSYQNYAWRGNCHSCSRAVSSREGSWKQWWWQSCKKSRLRERLSGVTSRRSAKGCGAASLSVRRRFVEDAVSAKTEEQDRLKALDASIVDVEKVHGGKPDMATKEAGRRGWRDRSSRTRCSPASPPMPSSGDRGKGKGVHQARGFAEGGVDLTQLLLLKQQELSDAKNEAAEKAREVENAAGEAFGRGRLRRVGFASLFFCILLRATVTSAVGAWTCGVRFQRTFESNSRSGTTASDVETKASVDHHSEVLSQGSPATSQQADPVSSTPMAATITRSAVRPKLLSAPSVLRRLLAGFQMSKSKERPPGAEQISNAVAKPLPDAKEKVGVLRRGQRVLRPAQGSRILSFTRWQIFHEEFLMMSCRGRGLMKGLQPEVLEQISRWPPAQARGCEACT